MTPRAFGRLGGRIALASALAFALHAFDRRFPLWGDVVGVWFAAAALDFAIRRFRRASRNARSAPHWR